MEWNVYGLIWLHATVFCVYQPRWIHSPVEQEKNTDQHTILEPVAIDIGKSQQALRVVYHLRYVALVGIEESFIFGLFIYR